MRHEPGAAVRESFAVRANVRAMYRDLENVALHQGAMSLLAIPMGAERPQLAMCSTDTQPYPASALQAPRYPLPAPCPLDLPPRKPLDHRTARDEARLPFANDPRHASLRKIAPARIDALDVIEPSLAGLYPQPRPARFTCLRAACASPCRP